MSLTNLEPTVMDQSVAKINKEFLGLASVFNNTYVGLRGQRPHVLVKRRFDYGD